VIVRDDDDFFSFAGLSPVIVVVECQDKLRPKQSCWKETIRQLEAFGFNEFDLNHKIFIICPHRGVSIYVVIHCVFRQKKKETRVDRGYYVRLGLGFFLLHTENDKKR